VKPKKTSFRNVLRYFPGRKRVLAIGATCLVVGQLLAAASPQVLKAGLEALERAVPGSSSAAGTASRLALVYVAVVAAQGLLTFLMRMHLIGFSRDVERDLKRDIFAHVATLPASFFDRMRTGDLLSRLTGDVEAVRFSIGPGVMYLGQTAVKLPAALAAMLWMDARLTLVLLVPLAAIAVAVRRLSPAVLRRSRTVQDRAADLASRAQESFAGVRVVKAYAVEEHEKAEFRARNEVLLEEQLGLARSRATMFGALRLLGDLGLVAVVWLGGTFVMGGETSRATLIAFLFYLDMLMWPMISFGYVLASFQRAAGAMQRIDEVLETPAEPVTTDAAAGELPPRSSGAVEVRALTFSYPGASRPALTDVSVSVAAGSTLAVVGPVGSGKSTLVAVLARLYEPPPGTVFVDGTDVRRIPLERLRATFSFVPQDAFLYSDTLAANLAYGVRGDAPRERLEAAAEAAGLAPDLERFPAGLDTVVGERGITLSGGQRQRATIARALAREAPILVIDDALSAVDVRTEARILDGLRDARRGRTAILVAHRLSTVRDADEILVLDAGRVVERGTHDALVAAGGWYARTWRLQRLHAEIEEIA
jgi:ATP-binding cassette, subfamily B, multidrug efflux pump